MKTKKVNKTATIQVILEEANRFLHGISIDVQKFNEKMNSSAWEAFLLEACTFLGLQPIYEDTLE
jgi:hypothetical protein